MPATKLSQLELCWTHYVLASLSDAPINSIRPRGTTKQHTHIIKKMVEGKDGKMKATTMSTNKVAYFTNMTLLADLSLCLILSYEVSVKQLVAKVTT